MKIRTGYVLRKVMDAYVIVGIGSAAYAPYEIMSVNETGAFLWDLLLRGADEDELAGRLAEEYDVDLQTARRDIASFLARLREKALIEE